LLLLLFEGQSDARGVGGTSSPSSSPKNIRANPRARLPFSYLSLCVFFSLRGSRCSLSLFSEREYSNFKQPAKTKRRERATDEAESERVFFLFSLSLEHKRSLSHTVCVVCVCVLVCVFRARVRRNDICRFSLLSVFFPCQNLFREGRSAKVLFVPFLSRWCWCWGLSLDQKKKNQQKRELARKKNAFYLDF